MTKYQKGFFGYRCVKTHTAIYNAQNMCSAFHLVTLSIIIEIANLNLFINLLIKATNKPLKTKPVLLLPILLLTGQ